MVKQSRRRSRGAPQKVARPNDQVKDIYQSLMEKQFFEGSPDGLGVDKVAFGVKAAQSMPMRHNSDFVVGLAVLAKELLYLCSSLPQLVVAFTQLIRPDQLANQFLLLLQALVLVIFKEFIENLLVFLAQDLSYFPMCLEPLHVLKVNIRELFSLMLQRYAQVTTVSEGFSDFWADNYRNLQIAENDGGGLQSTPKG